MASKYNFDAQRAADVTVRSTSKQADKSWDTVKEREPQPWTHSEPMPTKPPEITPRVIRLELESKDAVSVLGDTITWRLNMPNVGKLLPQTMVYWTSLVSNQTEVTDWAFSGLNTYRHNMSGKSYDLRARFTSKGSDTFVPGTSGMAPVAGMLKVETIFVNYATVTLERIGATGTPLSGIGSFYLRTYLTFVEPGARYV